MQTSEFNRLMKYSHLNVDQGGVLLTIYDNDITTCSPSKILNSKLIATIVNGIFVHNPNQL